MQSGLKSSDRLLGWITRGGDSAAGVGPVATSPIMAIKVTSNAVRIGGLGVMGPPFIKSCSMKSLSELIVPCSMGVGHAGPITLSAVFLL